jgi:hypothetical protein
MISPYRPQGLWKDCGRTLWKDSVGKRGEGRPEWCRTKLTLWHHNGLELSCAPAENGDAAHSIPASWALTLESTSGSTEGGQYQLQFRVIA